MKKTLIIATILTLAFTSFTTNAASKESQSSAQLKKASLQLAIDPNDENSILDGYSFAFVPMIYMQDYEGLKMPNNQDVSKSGNLLCCICMIASYEYHEWITPDNIQEKLPSIFDDNGNIDLDIAIKTISKNGYEKAQYDYYNMAKALSERKDSGQSFPIILVRVPRPSMYGNNSTYLIVTGLTENGGLAVRDPNKNNIEKYSIGTSAENSPMYDYGDFIVSIGNNSKMYIIY